MEIFREFVGNHKIMIAQFQHLHLVEVWLSAVCYGNRHFMEIFLLGSFFLARKLVRSRFTFLFETIYLVLLFVCHR